MNKHLKKLAVLATVLTLSMGVGAAVTSFTGCGDNNNKIENVQETLTITVVDQYGEAVEGATISVAGNNVTTNANGVATFSADKGEYFTMVTGVPSGYTNSANTSTTLNTTDNKSVTFTINNTQSQTYTHKITVQLADGTPVSNVMVNFCGTGANASDCTPARTNSKGVVTYEKTEGALYHIQILSGIPAGYEWVIPSDSTPEAGATDTAVAYYTTKTDITIVLTAKK